MPDNIRKLPIQQLVMTISEIPIQSKITVQHYMGRVTEPTHICDISACMVAIAAICHYEKWLHSADQPPHSHTKEDIIKQCSGVGPQEDISGSLY